MKLPPPSTASWWTPIPSRPNGSLETNGPVAVTEDLSGFAWETLRSFLDGVSPIDLGRLAFPNREQATEFLQHYGYNLESPIEAEDARSVYREALDYLQRVLCPSPHPGERSLTMPPELGRVEHLPDLLVMASGEDAVQPWACALLRVMHTISHANHAVRSPFYQEIQRQILARYREHLTEHTDSESGGTSLYLGRGFSRVPLDGIFFREEKNRDSLILKLLHKPDNVAQDVFDRIGVKMVTPTRVDALLAVRYIRMHNLAMFSNIAPGRARNNLIDVELFRQVLGSLPPGTGETAEVRVARNLERFLHIPSPNGDSSNPHSSAQFRSIQFTCRQLIRIANPVSAATRKLREELLEVWPPEKVEQRLSAIELHGGEETLRFFFPYEVQIIDRENHLLSEDGEASHANYRLRQLRVARKRVLGKLLA